MLEVNLEFRVESWNWAFDICNVVFSKLGLKLPWASKKSRLEEMVPTTAHIAREDPSRSPSSLDARTRSLWLLDLSHTTCETKPGEVT